LPNSYFDRKGKGLREDAMSAAEYSLHHVSLYVRDVNRSAEFYARVLGLREIPNRVGKAHIRWFDLDGLRTIHLIGGDEVAERPRPFPTHLALVTPRLDDTVARLREANVTFVNLAREPNTVHQRADGVRQLYFQDPDGHWIEINDGAEGP
jgi:lactoylglutathione lyase